jgi:uncharacterized RDD family membrane protein YckC
MTYPLGEDKVVIGRSRSCDVRLREDTVSRLHAAFVWREAQLVLEDLGSSNGTFLNGARVLAPQEVAAGDVVRFGALRGNVERSDLPPDRPGMTGINHDYADDAAPARPAGLGWRLLAVTADMGLFLLGSGVPFAPLLLTLLVERHFLAPDTLPPSLQMKSMLTGACATLWLVYAFFYFVHGWARRGGSPGMKLVRLRLLDWRHRLPIGYSRAFLRLAAGVVTVLTLGLGFLVIPFRRDRKALHDLLAGTMVVHRPRPLGQSSSSA